MKKLKTFENFTKEEIKNILLKAQKNSDIKIENIDDFLNKYMTPKERFGFNAIVDEEARFLSEADYQRMGEYIQKFKELGLDTSKLEELYPKLQKYKQIQLRELDNYHSNKKIEKLYDQMDRLQPFVDELEIEVKKLAKQAKNLL